MEASWNGGTLKSSIWMGISIFDEAFWGSSICGNPQVDIHLTEDPSFQEPILARKAGGAYLDANDRDSS